MGAGSREAFGSPPSRMEHTIDMGALGADSPYSACGSPDEPGLTTPAMLERAQSIRVPCRQIFLLEKPAAAINLAQHNALICTGSARNTMPVRAPGL